MIAPMKKRAATPSLRDLVQPPAALRSARLRDCSHGTFAGIGQLTSVSQHLLQGLLPIGAMVLFTAAANQSMVAVPRRRELTACTMSETNYLSRGTNCNSHQLATEGSWESCSASCLANPTCIGLQTDNPWDHCEMIFNDSVEDCPDGGFTFYPKECPSPTPRPTPRPTSRPTGYVITDSQHLFTAVSAWITSRSSAEYTYGHISTWDTSRVTDMECMFNAGTWTFCIGWGYYDLPWHGGRRNTGAVSFNDDISAWDTSRVTSMAMMFGRASSFNQPIGGWDTANVKYMRSMFLEASSFNRPLGDWNVEAVTSMWGMFNDASSFNQPLGEWQLDALTDMGAMFRDASSFNQDLGWCLNNGVGYSFEDTQCASTDCGVTQRDANDICPTPRPTYVPTTSPTQAPVLRDTSSGGSGGADMGPIIGAVVGVVLLLAVGALWFYRRRKGSEAKSSAVDPPPEPKLEPLEQPGEEATVLAVALEAEEILAEQPAAAAKGWFSAFSATEPEGEPESAPFPPEAEGTVAAAEEAPPLADWEREMNASEAAAEQGTGFQMPSALEGELEPEW